MQALLTIGIIGLMIVLIFVATVVRKVPLGKVYIIDRRGHFLKKVRWGYYFFNPATDKITTEISKDVCIKKYLEIFETFDEVLVQVQYSAFYRTEDIDRTLDALEQSRRSIDDVLNCAVYNVILNNNYEDIMNEPEKITEEIRKKATFDVDTLNFILDDLKVSQMKLALENKKKKFTPHISANSGPIKY